MKRSVMGGCLGTLLIMQHSSVFAEEIITAEPVQYLKICDVLGEGFIEIPSSDACLKISGSVTYDMTFGADIYSAEHLKKIDHKPGATLDFDVQSQTDFGLLRSFFSLDVEAKDEEQYAVTLSDAYIELGGLLIGSTGSQFDMWLNGAGNVLSDDVIIYGGGTTNQMAYTVNFSDRVSAILALEQGDEDYLVKDYQPHMVLGAKLDTDQGDFSAILGYDAVEHITSLKARIDVEYNDALSLFAMAAYNTGSYSNYFAQWNGKYAIWAGLSYALTGELTFNAQAAYEAAGTSAYALNLEREFLPGFIVTAELDYTSLAQNISPRRHAFGGLLSVERGF